MTNTVLLKRSATANSAPSAGSLLYGELAINYADGNLYYLNSANAVTVIASNKTISLSGNITAGNILTGGLISATGNITSAGNVNAREMTVTGNSLNTYAVDIAGNLRAHLINIDDLFVSNITLYNQLTGNGGNIAITSSNVNVGGAISATGNITGKYFLGNANIQYTASTAPTTGNLIGAQWYNTSTDALYEWQTDGTSTYWVDITGPVVGTTGGATGNIIVNGTSNVTIPTANGNAGINIGGTANVAIFATTGAYVTGVLSASGNITTGGNLTTTGAVYSNYNTNTANTGSFMATGGNTKGGTGYLDFLVVQNTSGGATNPYKWLRLNSTGALEIINSAYSATLLSLSDAGVLSVPGPISISGKQAVNGPAFSAYANATLQTITSGSQQKVLFQTEEFDTNSNYASSRFTPTVEGYYQLNAEVRLDGATGTGECMIILYKNGSEYKRGWNSSGTQFASNFWAMTVSSVVYANGTGDYFEIYVQQGSGGSISVTAVNNSAITWFNGCMLRGA